MYTGVLLITNYKPSMFTYSHWNRVWWGCVPATLHVTATLFYCLSICNYSTVSIATKVTVTIAFLSNNGYSMTAAVLAVECQLDQSLLQVTIYSSTILSLFIVSFLCDHRPHHLGMIWKP